MIKKISLVDMLMLFAAIASLVFSETLYFQGQKEAGLFVGLWVPSILGFAIYLKLILKEIKNDWVPSLFRRVDYPDRRICVCLRHIKALYQVCANGCVD